MYDAKTEMSVLKNEKLKTKRNRAPREDSSPLRDGEGSPVSTRFDEKPISSAPETTTTLTSGLVKLDFSYYFFLNLF